jgi:chromosome segregation ATPase
MAKTPEELSAALNALDTEIAAISGQRRALKQKMRELVGERDKLAAQVATQKTLAAMSPAEREALKAALDKQQKIAPAAV